MGRRAYQFDSELYMKDVGLVAASAAATVGGDAKVAEVGDAAFWGVLVIDVTAVEIASNDELYTITVQGSSELAFGAGTIENMAQLSLGATEVRPGGAKDSTVGRFELPFVNEQDGVTYPYLRVYTTVAGSIATGINYTAWIGRLVAPG